MHEAFATISLRLDRTVQLRESPHTPIKIIITVMNAHIDLHQAFSLILKYGPETQYNADESV